MIMFQKGELITMDKYLSVITNFGCHWTCPYCIVKNNNIDIPHTTINGLDELENEYRKNNCNWISVSGGGDPLFNLESNRDWYDRFLNIALKLGASIEMHTSIIFDSQNLADRSWLPKLWDRIVYHLNTFTQLYSIKRYHNEIVRVVFVVDETFTPELICKIANFVKNSTEIDELSFRQMVDSNYETTHYCEEFLKAGHQQKWWYITQCDYNLYYCENQVSTKYEDFKKEKSINE